MPHKAEALIASDPPPSRLSVYVEELLAHPKIQEAFVYRRTLPARNPLYGPPIDTASEIRAVLEREGIERLYRHQSAAVEALREGRNVVVATPTASGKSLIYNLVVLESLLADPHARALYLFPLKALEQDQFQTLSAWMTALGPANPGAAVYDGDTPSYQRQKIRNHIPGVVFTNPDMLHRALLPHHHVWKELFGGLRFVVLDEIHTYRGVFGSHLNQVIRRLKRICRMYGSTPRFVLLSATIQNPGAFAETLIEEPVAVIESDQAPRAGQHFVFLNPESGADFSAARLFLHSVRRGFRTIVFTQSRKVTELIHLWVSQLSPALRKKISSYRGGFLAEERRRIEQGLAGGDLLGVVSTSALEMGIDIGHLDICILVGYPGTVINTWQRGGRVGRAGRESLIVLLGKPDALDQYFMKHPDNLFERGFEAAVLDPNNPYVVADHLPCAASEAPLSPEDATYWPVDFEARLESLEGAGRLLRSAEDPPLWFSARRNPQRQVSLRSTGGVYTIFDKETGQAVGTIDEVRAFKECHPGAVYLHRARQYVVDALVVDKRDIIVHPAHPRYFTRVLTEKETEILEVLRSRPEEQFLVREGRLKVTETVSGYEKRALPGQEKLGVFPLELPPMTFETRGLWIEIEPLIQAYIERQGGHFMGGIHALEHAAIGIFPLFALCDRNDIGGICYPHHPQVGKSAVFIYDGYPGGVGLAQRGYEIIGELLRKTLEHVEECDCEEGCPSCIHSPKCGSGNKPLDKRACIDLLHGLLGKVSFREMGAEGEAETEEPGPVLQPDPVVAEPARKGPCVLYLDLETRKSAQDVGGWRNAHLMGVSVVVIYDSALEDFAVFYEKDLTALFERLETADLVVGFNISRFDYRVLSAYAPGDLNALPTFDILQDIQRRLGYRISLDHLARETLQQAKTGNGLQALEWYRNGEMEKLTDYCRQDVAVTRDLFQYGLEQGHLIYKEKRSGIRLRVRVDWKLEELVG